MVGPAASGGGEPVGQLSEALRERGLRLTLQREIILDTLEGMTGHIAVEDVYRRIHPRFPQVNVSTIYRTLELLEQSGLIAHTHFHDGAAKWHRTEEAHHQHLVCERCGTEIDLDVALIAPLERTLRTRYGFAANFEHFAIVGICRNCQP
jgi:Fur family transcriptional regulator, ferric uptake regulator